MTPDLSDTLPTRLLKLRDHVRDTIVPQYEACGPAGEPALALVIRPALENADAMLLLGSAAGMIQAIAALEGIE